MGLKITPKRAKFLVISAQIPLPERFLSNLADKLGCDYKILLQDVRRMEASGWLKTGRADVNKRRKYVEFVREDVILRAKEVLSDG